MAAHLWRRLAGNAVIAATLRGQKGIPYLARPQLEALRDRQVRAMVTYAARHVPYYRDWFARSRVDPKTITAAADLERLPILDKNLLRARPDLFRAESAAGRTALAFLTSGTTGTPIEIHHDRRSLLANFAYGERERVPVNQLCGGAFRPRELYVGYTTSTFKKVQAFYAQSTLLPVRPQRSFVSLLEPIEKIAAMVDTQRPDVLVGYGAWVDLFFKTIEARRLEVSLPRVVMYIGEALPYGARELIEGRFGVALLSRYNAVEAFKIGFTCEQRTGFHLHEDLCHVRIVDDAGQTVAPGQAGRILISNLVNRATVLINYPIGDVGTLGAGRCACGRTLQLLCELEGRVEDVLALPGGRFVHPRAIWQVFKESPKILQYQLVQRAPQRFELKLVTVDDAAFQRAMARCLPELQAVLGATASIDAERCTEIPRQSGEKFRAVESYGGTSGQAKVDA
jgi:phenylacetate-CoA ligase